MSPLRGTLMMHRFVVLYGEIHLEVGSRVCTTAAS